MLLTVMLMLPSTFSTPTYVCLILTILTNFMFCLFLVTVPMGPFILAIVFLVLKIIHLVCSFYASLPIYQLAHELAILFLHFIISYSGLFRNYVLYFSKHYDPIY